MIYVCDAIMGSGKSSAAIAYMNANPNKKFVYITPYLKETDRIRYACPELGFVSPAEKDDQNVHWTRSKKDQFIEMLHSGKNIATTHQLLKRYTEETCNAVKEHEYTLIIDESVDIACEVSLSRNDYEFLTRVGEIAAPDEDGIVPIDYDASLSYGRYKDIFFLGENGKIVNLQDDSRKHYWTMNYDILTSFKDVYILTYMFYCQDMRYYLDVNGLDYGYIGIHHPAPGVYNFSLTEYSIPDYVGKLKDMIAVYKGRRNRIGDKRTALSSTDLNRQSRMDALKKELNGYLKYDHKDISNSKKMWCSFKKTHSTIKRKGTSSCFVPFNTKASNDYCDRHILAYGLNVFLTPDKKIYFSQQGVEFDEDGYALSTMLQWIWRSAIRKGEPIEIYVPSSRMRNLLIDWIENPYIAGLQK